MKAAETGITDATTDTKLIQTSNDTVDEASDDMNTTDTVAKAKEHTANSAPDMTESGPTTEEKNDEVTAEAVGEAGDATEFSPTIEGKDDERTTEAIVTKPDNAPVQGEEEA